MKPLPAWIQELLPEHRRYFTEVGERRIHVMEFGPESGVPLLCIHGNPTWGFLYRRIAAQLADYPVRVIAPDLPGLGFSDRPDFSEHTLDNHARWMAAFVESLELEGYGLVIQDWGGPIGLLGAGRAGGMRALIVLNTVIGPPRPGFKATAFHRFSKTPGLSDIAFRLLGFPQIDLGMAQGDRGSISGAVSKAYRFPLKGLRNNAAPLAMARMVPDSTDHASIPSLRETFSYFDEFDGPTEVVWGMRDPVLGGVIRYLRKIRPDATFTITQAGHFLQEEVPAEIATACLRALRDADLLN